MSRRTFAGWFVITAVLSFSIGATIGMQFTKLSADKVLGAAELRYRALKSEFDEISNACIMRLGPDPHIDMRQDGMRRELQ